MPLPLTVAVSVSTGVAPPLLYNVKVIVPVGELPPESTAESVRVVAVEPSVTVAGLGVPASDGWGRPKGWMGPLRTLPPTRPTESSLRSSNGSIWRRRCHCGRPLLFVFLATDVPPFRS